MHFVRPAKSATVVAAALLFALILAPVAAKANTATATMAVTATVQTDCSVTANPLAFGNYSGAALNQNTTISVTCTNTTPYNVGLSAGSGNNATVTSRSMTCGTAGGCATTAYLNYSLLSGSYTGTNWGNTSADNWVAGTGNGGAQSITIYGVVAAGQYVTPGSYADSITVTVNY
jgi:spore coat protein U-like protein